MAVLLVDDDRDLVDVLTYLLRREGYPNATCYCERSVELAMARRSRCVVTRDGDTPAFAQH